MQIGIDSFALFTAEMHQFCPFGFALLDEILYFYNPAKTTPIMKKFFLSALVLLFAIPTFSQDNPFTMDIVKMKLEQAPSKIKSSEIKRTVHPFPEIPTPDRDVNIVSVIDIGTSANALTYWEKLSYLWVSPELYTVTNIHRLGGALDAEPGNPDLGYDISKDGGETWQNMITLFEAELSDMPRYHNHGIFNPESNPEPDAAFVTYFSSQFFEEASNSYLHGVGSIGDTSYHTATNLMSDDQFHQAAPSGFDLTSDGKVFVVDANQDWSSGELEYLDSLIITKGTWDNVLQDITYTRELLEAQMTEESGSPIDLKVAFGTDGQTGYIVAIGDNGMAEQVDGFQNLYPIYWKTEDGGESWDGPHFIQVDGPSGMNGIVNHHLTDEQIAELFGPNPPARTEISYTTAYDCDIAVDDNNRLHIAVVIGPTGIDPYSIVTAENYIVAYDLFEENPTNPFCAVRMGSLRTFRGNLGDDWTFYYDNRIQITTNPAADKIFISWLDTDLENEDDNNRPNIWVRGFDPHTYQRTISWSGEDGPANVTLFSEGMWQAYLFAAPKTAFESNGIFNIPFVYVALDSADLDPLLPIQFKYIQDFSFSYNDFYNEGVDYIRCGFVGIEDQPAHDESLKIYGNIPNPFREETAIQIELSQASHVGVTVFSITGQQIIETTFGKLTTGNHQLTLNMAGFSPGIYMYTVTAGQHSITKKMLVE